MKIIPAIDLRGGRCVRLLQGDFHQETVFSDNPLEVAKRWAQAGATRLHLVDLDAARGVGDNRDVIESISGELSLEIEVGGGLRTMADLEELFSAGASYGIIGTAAYRDPEFVAQAVGRYPGQIFVGIDARDGQVALQGWLETAQISAIELGKQMKELGMETVIFTDISRDGTLTGPNTKASLELARKTGLKVIVSGGVSGYEDLAEVSAAAVAGEISGVIVGKALYTGNIDLAEALQRFEEGN